MGLLWLAGRSRRGLRAVFFCPWNHPWESRPGLPDNERERSVRHFRLQRGSQSGRGCVHHQSTLSANQRAGRSTVSGGRTGTIPVRFRGWMFPFWKIPFLFFFLFCFYLFFGLVIELALGPKRSERVSMRRWVGSVWLVGGFVCWRGTKRARRRLCLDRRPAGDWSRRPFASRIAPFWLHLHGWSLLRYGTLVGFDGSLPTRSHL